MLYYILEMYTFWFVFFFRNFVNIYLSDVVNVVVLKLFYLMSFILIKIVVAIKKREKNI